MIIKEVAQIETFAYMCIVHFKDGTTLEIESRSGDELSYNQIEGDE